MHDIDRLVFDLAARQHGAFARWQLLDIDLADALIVRRVRARRWIPVRTGVYVLPGLPPDPARDVWVAWLAVGAHAVVSFECAAERQDLGPVLTGRLVFTTNHGDHHRLRGITVHQLRDVLPHHVHDVGGLPTTTVPRTIVDLAAASRRMRLGLIVENAVNDGRTTDDEIGCVVGEVNRYGKRGMGNIVSVLGSRAPGEPVPDSVLEPLLLGAARLVGLPDPIPQYPHPGRVPGKGRVDYAYPEAMLILEADGRRWHQRIADLKRDRARDNEAARAGWLTLRFMWEELKHDPEDVGRTILETLAHRTPAAK